MGEFKNKTIELNNNKLPKLKVPTIINFVAIYITINC